MHGFVAEFGPEVVNNNDLQLFFQKFVPSLVGALPIVVAIDGGILANGKSLAKIILLGVLKIF